MTCMGTVTFPGLRPILRKLVGVEGLFADQNKISGHIRSSFSMTDQRGRRGGLRSSPVRWKRSRTGVRWARLGVDLDEGDNAIQTHDVPCGKPKRWGELAGMLSASSLARSDELQVARPPCDIAVRVGGHGFKRLPEQSLPRRAKISLLVWFDTTENLKDARDRNMGDRTCVPNHLSKERTIASSACELNSGGWERWRQATRRSPSSRSGNGHHVRSLGPSLTSLARSAGCRRN